MQKLGAFFFVLAWVIVASVLAFALAPTVETKFFPPYSTFHLIEAVDQPGGVLATFEFTKNRDCAPKGLAWYLGEVGDSTSVDTSAPRGTRSPRPLGEQLSSPYLFAGITKAELETEVIAVIRNQCAFPFTEIPLPWVTVSWVYP